MVALVTGYIKKKIHNIFIFFNLKLCSVEHGFGQQIGCLFMTTRSMLCMRSAANQRV